MFALTTDVVELARTKKSIKIAVFEIEPAIT